MILQIGGSISFAPEGEGAEAKWLSDDTRHMLAELDPAPDQVTIAIDTGQMNIMELMTENDTRGTSLERPGTESKTYREMTVPAGPTWVEGASAPSAGRGYSAALPAWEHSAARDRGAVDSAGLLHGPLDIHVGGDRRRAGRAEPVQHPMKFIRRVPDGASLTLETLMRSVLPVNTMAIAMGLHTRCGNEDNMWAPRGGKITSAEQVRQLVRVAGELGRDVATAKEARECHRIG